MARKIQIDIEVNGKMQKATVDAKNLRKQLGGIDEGMGDVAKSARQADRNIKGTAQASSNATKNFSKMSQGMGGLVGAYASLAASLFAVSAAFNFLKSAGELKSLRAGQVAYASATGVAINTLTEDIIRATDSQIAFKDAAQAAAIGSAAGLNADQLTRLGKAAADASQILGRDVTDSFNRLVRGATKAEPELLDELGIILRLDDASRKYAEALNINQNSLTTFQKGQAVTTEILAQAEGKYGKILDIIGRTPNQYAQLQKAFDDIIMKVKEVVDEIAGPLAKVLQETPAIAVASLGVLLSGPLRALGLSFTGIADAAKESAAEQLEFYRNVSDEVKIASKNTEDFKQDLQSLARVGIADGAKGGFLTTLSRGKDLSGTEVARFKAAVTAAENHVNSAGVVVKGAFTGMKIHMVREMSEAYTAMNAAQSTTLKKTQLFSLRMKGYFAGISAVAKAAAAGIASAFSSALSLVSYAALAFTGYQMYKELTAGPMTEEDLQLEKQARDAQVFLDRLVSINKEFSQFAEIQKELSSAGSLKFYENMSSFFGANTAAEFKTMREIMQETGLTQQEMAETSEESSKKMYAGFAAMATGAFMLRNALNFVAAAVPHPLVKLGSKALAIGAGAVGGYFLADDFIEGAKDAGHFSEERKEFLANEKRNAAIKERAVSMRDVLRTSQEISKISFPEVDRLLETLDEIIATEGPINDALGENFEKGTMAVSKLTEELAAAAKELSQLQNKFRSFMNSMFEISEASQLMASFEVQLEQQRKILKDMASSPGTSSEAMQKQSTVVSGLARQVETLKKTAELQRRQKERENEAALQMVDIIGNETDERQEQIRLANEELQIRTNIANLVDEIETKKLNMEVMIDFVSDGEVDGFTTPEGRMQFLESQTGQDAMAALKQLGHDLAQLGKQLNVNLQQQGVAAEKAAVNTAKEKEKELQIQRQIVQEKQKEVQAQREILEIIKQFDARAIDKTLRDDRLRNPFGYLTADNTRARMERDSARSLIKLEKEQIEREYQVKSQMISAEYALLREKINVARMEADLSGDGLTEGQSEAYGRLKSQLNNAEQAQQAAASAAADNAKAAADERLEQLEAEVIFTNQLFIEYENLAMSFEEGMVDAFGQVIAGSMKAKDAFRAFAEMMIQEASRAIAKLLIMEALTKTMSMITGAPGVGPISALFQGGRYGGVMKAPRARHGGVFDKYSTGGVARGSDAGYLAMLHGTEAVVPLPNGRSIPVEMSGGGAQTNNVSVNVNVQNDGRTDTTTEGDSREMGKAIAAAVQQEIQTQRRPGGLLSPYGAR